MGKLATIQVAWMTAMGLSGLLAFNSAYAGPPQNRSTQNMAQRLDLSAPSALLEQTAKGGGFRSLASSRQAAASDEHLQLPNLGTGMHAQPTMQERVQQFHRDGLPLARLWENHSALVHLGLNQKGKPGLWIIQKLH